MDNPILLLIFIAGLILSIFWLLFPILVNSKLTKLIKLQADSLAVLQEIRDADKSGWKAPSGVVPMPPSAFGEKK